MKTQGTTDEVGRFVPLLDTLDFDYADFDLITPRQWEVNITGRSITTGTPWRSSFKKNEKKPLKFYIEGGESFNYKITYMDYILEDDSSTVISIIYFKIIDKASQCRGEGRYLLSNK